MIKTADVGDQSSGSILHLLEFVQIMPEGHTEDSLLDYSNLLLTQGFNRSMRTVKIEEFSESPNIEDVLEGRFS